MIITGYQGIGKTTLANERYDIIDLESSSFWKVDKKGNRTRPDDWYVYYCQIAQHLSKSGYQVFVSSHIEVREYLSTHNGEPFCAIFPSRSIKDEWIDRLYERYKMSGSNKDLRALEHAKEYFDRDIDRFLYECSYGVEYYHNVYAIEDINYQLEDIIEKLCYPTMEATD